MPVRRQPLRLLAPLTKKAAAKRRRCGKKGKKFGKLGGNTNNISKEERANLGRTLGGNTNNKLNEERMLASIQGCEK